MFIGRIAKRTSLSVDAIRFYERNGILAPPQRSEGGFRLYTDQDVEALLFVRRAQGLGFSLPQIRELLALSRDRGRSCAAVRERLQRKLADVRAKIGVLEHLDGELRIALRHCERELRKRASRCPLLEASSKQQRQGSR
ncbi:MAG TPA: MerR family DNA-binding protein [Candidatus Acidoferrales bacterium]|nr:MerR family DNA-binding protein [Candidatus Acidoferrales bacterium]